MDIRQRTRLERLSFAITLVIPISLWAYKLIETIGAANTTCNLLGFPDAKCTGRALIITAFRSMDWMPLLMLVAVGFFYVALKLNMKRYFDGQVEKFEARVHEAEWKFTEASTSLKTLQMTVNGLPLKGDFEKALRTAQHSQLELSTIRGEFEKYREDVEQKFDHLHRMYHERLVALEAKASGTGGRSKRRQSHL